MKVALRTSVELLAASQTMTKSGPTLRIRLRQASFEDDARQLDDGLTVIGEPTTVRDLYNASIKMEDAPKFSAAFREIAAAMDKLIAAWLASGGRP